MTNQPGDYAGLLARLKQAERVEKHKHPLLSTNIYALSSAAIEALKRELAEARAALEWRPIATAPKDGSVQLYFEEPELEPWQEIWTAHYLHAQISKTGPMPAATYMPKAWRHLPGPPANGGRDE